LIEPSIKGKLAHDDPVDAGEPSPPVILVV